MSDRCTCHDVLVIKDLNRWFKEKWVDVSRKDKDGKHPPCGRPKASKSSKGYPKCRPSVKVSSKTPRTSGSMSEGEKRAATKRKRAKKQGVGGKPTIVKARTTSGFYRTATIPDDKSQPVRKVPHDSAHAPNRFATLALSQALADMNLPIVPETPVRGAVEQQQMEKVFGPGRDNFHGHEQEVESIVSDPLMQFLSLSDAKGPNVGLQDGQVRVFDPAFRSFRGHRYVPIDYQRGEFDPNYGVNLRNQFGSVDKDKLAELAQRVKNYRPMLDVWEGDLSNRAWQGGMTDYMQARDTLQFLSSIQQDPNQMKLFEYGNPAYANMVNDLRSRMPVGVQKAEKEEKAKKGMVVVIALGSPKKEEKVEKSDVLVKRRMIGVQQGMATCANPNCLAQTPATAGACQTCGSPLSMQKAERDPRLARAGVSGFNKPKRTPNHPKKSHVVVAREGGQVKTIRFGQQGVSGSPKKEGESDSYRKRRESFKARHAKNISRGKLSAAYWADKVKW